MWAALREFKGGRMNQAIAIAPNRDILTRQDWDRIDARREHAAGMKALAFELVECLTLEAAGVRDGDGRWHGCDPIRSIINDLVGLDKARDGNWPAADEVPF
jgi:hypothetical protein